MRPWLIVFLVAAAASIYAKAPESLNGCLYRLRSVVGADVENPRPGLFPQIIDRTLLLISDGTFVRVLGGGGTGRWRYERQSDDVAFLFINDSRQTLTFIDERSGSWTDALSNIRTDSAFEITFPSARSKMPNCSNLSYIRSGDSATAGFVLIADGGLVLVRAIGPALAGFGISDALGSPRLRVFAGNGSELIAENIGWESGGARARIELEQSMQVFGAFPLRTGSADSAVVLRLPAGSYSVHVSSNETNQAGRALIEIYVLQ